MKKQFFLGGLILFFFAAGFLFFWDNKILAQESSPVCESIGAGRCLYVSPAGSGTTCSFASPCLFSTATGLFGTPGDVIYLRAGTYPENQIQGDINNKQGTAQAPLIIKNYPGESPVIYQEGSCVRRYMISFSNAQYLIFDGLTLKHDCNPPSGLYQYMMTINNSQHVTFKNGEIAGSETYRTLAGIQIQSSDYTTVENSYLHDFTPPTGCDDWPRTCTEAGWQQGDGEALYVYDSDFLLVQNNRVEKCNHACISITNGANAYVGSCRYARIKNNFVDARRGGGVYLTGNAEYSLVEGNIIVHAGDTTSKSKSGLFINSSNSTIRRNVIYSPLGGGLDLSANNAHTTAFPVYSSNNNLIYNNTVFGAGQGYAGSWSTPDDSGGYNLSVFVQNCRTACSVADNTFANNIFYKSTNGKAWFSSSHTAYEPEIDIDLSVSNNTNNWLEPDDASTTPTSTHWGGNKFYNNIVRRATDGLADEDVIVWLRSIWPTQQPYSINKIQNEDPVAWQNNLGADPLLISEDPDGFGLNNGWWRLKSGSPAIDGGRAINDSHGAYVETLYPGYGWSDLSYTGLTLDIGAAEYEASVLTVPPAERSDSDNTPSSPPVAQNGEISSFLAVGPASPGGPHIRIYDQNLYLYSQFFAYALSFRGGVNPGIGDVDGDGYLDIITGPGPGSASHLRIFDFAGRVKNQFFIYPLAWRLGLSVAAGDVDGDGMDEIITAPQSVAGPEVRVFKYDPVNNRYFLLNRFFAFPSFLRLSLNLAVGDLNNDGRAEILAVPRLRGGPQVRIFTFQNNRFNLKNQFFAYHTSFRGGVNLAVADADGDESQEIITGAGPGGGPHIRIFSETGRLKYQFYSAVTTFRGGVSVSAFDQNGDGIKEIVAGVYSSGSPEVKVFDFQNNNFINTKFFSAYQSNFRGGIRLDGY
ncbi:MAG: FG-GAP-like repeat-containing protein [Patescibacteria group bacterium]